MFQSFIFFFVLIFSLLFYKVKHPLSMGFLLLVQTLIVCLMTGAIYESFWFSYILFLAFVGGMLVLFIYVTSLASNEMFNFSLKLFILNFLCIIVLFFFTYFLVDPTLMSFFNNLEMINQDFNFFYKESFYCIYKLYINPSNFITILLINYLLFTLIVVVKITNFSFGPLRNLN